MGVISLILGFILAPSIALKLKCGFIALRKKGKLPTKLEHKHTINYHDHYSPEEKGFEINKSAVSKGDRILIIDEWIESGVQMKHATKFLESLGAKVVGIATIVAEKNKNTKELFDKYSLHYLGEPK